MIFVYKFIPLEIGKNRLFVCSIIIKHSERKGSAFCNRAVGIKFNKGFV